jgi:hypothetical protein
MKRHRQPHLRLWATRARAPRWGIQPRELQVLYAVRDGLVHRDPQYGDLAPWMLGTRPVDWSVTLLVLHRLVRLGAFGFGPPQITQRGRDLLDGWADPPAFGDQR